MDWLKVKTKLSRDFLKYRPVKEHSVGGMKHYQTFHTITIPKEQLKVLQEKTYMCSRYDEESRRYVPHPVKILDCEVILPKKKQKEVKE